MKVHMQDFVTQAVGQDLVSTLKVLNFLTPKMFAVITLKFKRRGLSLEKCV